MVEYLRQIWLANRSAGWMIVLNLILLVSVSLGFVEYFPESNNALEFFYQLGFLPSVWGLYGVLIFIVLAPLSLIPKARYFMPAIIATLGGTLAVMVYIDGYIYDIFNYHINWFFIEAFWADEGGEFFDISLKTYFLFSFVALLIAVCEIFFLWLVIFKITQRKTFRFAGLVIAPLLFAEVLLINVTHSWAYAQNYAPITSLGAHVPFYFPIHSKSLKDNELLNSLAGDEQAPALPDNIFYPKQDMVCENPNKPNIIMVVLESWRGDKLDQNIAPNTYALAQESQWFKEHHSSGSVTTKGIFSLMYGIAPTYMDNVVANNGAGGPVLLNVLKEQGYDFGIFPSGDITRIKLTDSSFSPVKPFVHHGEGKDTIEKDEDVLQKMQGLISESEKPYFGFMFFNSSHYLYYYPDQHEKFTPVEKPSLVDFQAGKNPEPYLNRYKNSLHFVDSLIGKMIDQLKAQGQWENTVFIVTSDHAEEFADTAPTRFGHGSNFTRYQTHVPLVVHWPGKSQKTFEHKTASIDVTATLLNELLKCENPISDYSNGDNLFTETPRDVQVVASYYNYAFVTPEGSFTQNPYGLLTSKNNMDKTDEELKLDPKKAFQALQQMKHFYEPAKP